MNNRIGIRISDELNNDLKKISIDRNVSVSKIVKSALESFVEIYHGKDSSEVLNNHLTSAITSTLDLTFDEVKRVMKSQNYKLDLITEILMEELDLSDEDIVTYQNKLKLKLVEK